MTNSLDTKGQVKAHTENRERQISLNPKICAKIIEIRKKTWVTETDQKTFLDIIGVKDEATGAIKQNKKRWYILSETKIKEVGAAISQGNKTNTIYQKIKDTYNKYYHYLENTNFLWEDRLLQGKYIGIDLYTAIAWSKEKWEERWEEKMALFMKYPKRLNIYLTNDEVYKIITKRLDARERAQKYIDEQTWNIAETYNEDMKHIFQNFFTFKPALPSKSKDIAASAKTMKYIMALAKNKDIDITFLEKIFKPENLEKEKILNTNATWEQREQIEQKIWIYLKEFYQKVWVIKYYNNEHTQISLTETWAWESDEQTTHRENCVKYKDSVNTFFDEHLQKLIYTIWTKEIKRSVHWQTKISNEAEMQNVKILTHLKKYLASPTVYGAIKTFKSFYDQFIQYQQNTQTLADQQKQPDSPYLLPQIYTHTTTDLMNEYFAKESWYRWFEKFLETHPAFEWWLNLQSWLNKKQYAQSSLKPEDRSSRNRYALWKKPFYTPEKIKQMEDAASLYLSFVNEVIKDKAIQERLKNEMWLQDWLEQFYFQDMKPWSIVRADFWDQTQYEFDDFPRGIFYATLLDEFAHKDTPWYKPHILKHFESMIQSGESIIFVLHESASWANFEEHKAMAQYLQYHNIPSACIDHEEFLQNVETNSDQQSLSYNGKKIGAVRHHMMNTKEAPTVINKLTDHNIRVLPHFHASSHKWLQSILSDMYDKNSLKDEYHTLIDDKIISYSKTINNPDQTFTFKQKQFTNIVDLIEKEKDVVIKLVWAENAEWVYILATSTKQEKTDLKNKLKNYTGWILLQEYNPNPRHPMSVYNAKKEEIQYFDAWMIARVFYTVWEDGSLKTLTTMEQGTHGNTAHGMADMTARYAWIDI